MRDGKTDAAINYTARKLQRLEQRLDRLEALLGTANTSRNPQTRSNESENGPQTDGRNTER